MFWQTNFDEICSKLLLLYIFLKQSLVLTNCVSILNCLIIPIFIYLSILSFLKTYKRWQMSFLKLGAFFFHNFSILIEKMRFVSNYLSLFVASLFKQTMILWQWSTTNWCFQVWLNSNLNNNTIRCKRLSTVVLSWK